MKINKNFPIKLSPNYLDLLKYTREVNKLEDNNQIILANKKDKLSIENVKVLVSNNTLNKKRVSTLFLLTAGWTGAPISEAFPTNDKKYFTQIDMLTKKKVVDVLVAPSGLNNLNTPGQVAVDCKKSVFCNANSLPIEEYKINNKSSNITAPESVIPLNTSLKKFNLDIVQAQNILYTFTNSMKLKLITNISTILENSFLTMSSFISKPVFHITPSKVVIQLFFFLVRKNPKLLRSKNNKFLALNKQRLELLCANLSKSLKKPVELDIVKLYSPTSDSTILANILGRISDLTFKPYIFILDKLFLFAKIQNPKISFSKSSSIIPSFITGLRIKLGGRLLKSKIIPRLSSKTTQLGSLTRSSADIIATGRFTTKNKRGTFSFTATIGHRFF